MIQYLGDSHNFGKRVYLKGGRVVKPRSLFWEALFLSGRSDFRIFLDGLFADGEMESPFRLAPDLDVQLTGPFSGSIEYLKLMELPQNFSLIPSDLNALGSLLAVCFWFGFGDLHHENLMIGLQDGKLICFPIDIESLFDHLTHLHQTLLVPSEIVPAEKIGLAKIWPLLESQKPEEKISILRSFAKGINQLNESCEDILRVITKLPGYEANPIRMIMRDTEFYRTAILNKKYSGFFQSEVEQMERGDVPYYFRYPHERAILYIGRNKKIRNADFSSSDFDRDEPNEVQASSWRLFLKFKTVILSLNYLATQLGLSSSFDRIDCVNVVYGKKTVSFHEDGSKVHIGGD